MFSGWLWVISAVVVANITATSNEFAYNHIGPTRIAEPLNKYNVHINNKLVKMLVVGCSLEEKAYLCSHEEKFADIHLRVDITACDC